MKLISSQGGAKTGPNSQERFDGAQMREPVLLESDTELKASLTQNRFVDDVFESTIGRQLFVINQVNLINRPKRLLLASPSKFPKLGNEHDRQAWSYFTYMPRQESLARNAKFNSADRFQKKPCMDSDLPYKKKLAEAHPVSDFEKARGF